MAISDPLWIQANEYSARQDRQFIDRVLHGAERIFDGMEVTATGTPGFSVQVAVGSAGVKGAGSAGMYLVDLTSTETSNELTAAGARTDNVLLVVNDVAEGAATNVPAIVLQDSADALPDAHILLATVARSAGAPIQTSDITDLRPLGPFPYGVGTTGPPAVGVEGDLYIQVGT